MRNSIRTRLIIAFIGLAIGPLLLVGVILAWQSFVTQEQQALNLQRQVAQRVATQVTAFFEQQENQLRLISQVQGLQQLDRDQQRRLLFRLLSYQNTFEELVLLDSQGREQIYLARLGLTSADLNDRAEADEFVIPQTTSQVYYSPVRFDEISGEPLITIAIPLLDVRTGQVDGVLIAETRLKKIWDLIADVRASPSQDVYIVDAQGNVVAHRNPSVVLRGTHFEVPNQDGLQPGLTGSSAVLAVDTARFGQQAFHIVAEQAVSEALAPAIHSLYLILAVILVALLVAGVLGMLMVRQIVHPIQVMAATAEAISAGDLSQQVELTRQDELGILADAFNSMTRELRHLITGLEQQITERKKAEETLRLTQQAVDRARDAIHWVGADGQLLYVNEATCQSLGYTREELLSMTIFDIDPLYAKETWADHWENERDLGHYKLESVHKTKDGRLFPVEIVVDRVNYAGQEFNCAYARDITERKRAEQIIQLRLRLMEFAATHSLEELLQKTLDEVGELTNSPIGFYHFVEADQKTLSLQAWSTRTLAEFCQAEGEGLHYPIDEAGVWVDCVHERRAVIHNDYESLPHRQGLPEGHAQVIRELVVPILRDDLIVAILGVGNKPHDYTDTDAEVAAYVADLAWEITERKQAEEASRESEERYRQLFELESDAIFLIDNETGRILEANGAASDMYGYSREELLAKKNSDLSAEPEDTQRVTRTTPPTTDQVMTIPLRFHRKKDGTVFPVEITGRFFIRQGRPVHIAAIRDITDRKQIEAELRRSEERYRDVIENQTELVSRARPDGTLTFVNEAYCRFYGRSREELLGSSLVTPELEEDRSLLEQIARLTPANPIRTDEHREIKVDGSIGWVQWTDRGIFDEAGQLIEVQSVGRDITERKQMEEVLRESEARYRAVIESQVDLISRYLPDTTLTFVNDAYCQFYGKTREELIGHSYLFMIAPEFRELVRKETEDLSKDPRPLAGEYLNYRHDGKECWIQWVVQCIADENGRVVELQAVGRDVTERKQAEEEIRRLNEELEQRVRERTAQLEAANKELEAFSYSVSHDLRTPLRAIDGYTRILMEDYETALGTEGHRVCAVIRHQTQRMGQLIDDLLAFSRLSRVDMRASEIDMEALANEVFREVTTPEERTRIDFLLRSLPPTVGDPTLIRQVWANLLANAVKFSAKRERAVVEAGSSQEAAENIYFVRDNGAGFDMQYADKLFGVFQRLHSEREFEGTGVGLAIIQRVIHRHGGRVWAEAEVDKGATFYFTLPQKEDPLWPR